MVKRSPTVGTLVSTKTKCNKFIFIGKITLVPVEFLMALSISSSLEPKGQWPWDLVCSIGDVGPTRFAQMMNLG